MIKYILIGSVCLYLLFYHFCIVALAGFIYGGVYLLHHFDLMPVVSEDRESNLPPRKKEHPTAEEVYAKQVDSLIKPGYKDDPRWKELAEKVRKHNAHQDKLSRQEKRLEELTNEVV